MADLPQVELLDEAQMPQSGQLPDPFLDNCDYVFAALPPVLASINTFSTAFNTQRQNLESAAVNEAAIQSIDANMDGLTVLYQDMQVGGDGHIANVSLYMPSVVTTATNIESVVLLATDMQAGGDGYISTLAQDFLGDRHTVTASQNLPIFQNIAASLPGILASNIPLYSDSETIPQIENGYVTRRFYSGKIYLRKQTGDIQGIRPTTGDESDPHWLLWQSAIDAAAKTLQVLIGTVPSDIDEYTVLTIPVSNDSAFKNASGSYDATFYVEIVDGENFNSASTIEKSGANLVLTIGSVSAATSATIRIRATGAAMLASEWTEVTFSVGSVPYIVDDLLIWQSGVNTWTLNGTAIDTQGLEEGAWYGTATVDTIKWPLSVLIDIYYSDDGSTITLMAEQEVGTKLVVHYDDFTLETATMSATGTSVALPVEGTVVAVYVLPDYLIYTGESLFDPWGDVFVSQSGDVITLSDILTGKTVRFRYEGGYIDETVTSETVEHTLSTTGPSITAAYVRTDCVYPEATDYTVEYAVLGSGTDILIDTKGENILIEQDASTVTLGIDPTSDSMSSVTVVTDEGESTLGSPTPTQVANGVICDNAGGVSVDVTNASYVEFTLEKTTAFSESYQYLVSAGGAYVHGYTGDTLNKSAATVFIGGIEYTSGSIGTGTLSVRVNLNSVYSGTLYIGRDSLDRFHMNAGDEISDIRVYDAFDTILWGTKTAFSFQKSEMTPEVNGAVTYVCPSAIDGGKVVALNGPDYAGTVWEKNENEEAPTQNTATLLFASTYALATDLVGESLYSNTDVAQHLVRENSSTEFPSATTTMRRCSNVEPSRIYTEPLEIQK